MTDYPYTGGIYGGYSDPANNQKKPFAGPQIDSAVSDARKSLAKSLASGYNSYRSGVEDTLRKTSEAYDKGGLGSAAGQYARGTLGDAGNALAQGIGKPLMAGVVKPALSLSGGVANFGKTLLTGDPSPVGSSQPKNPLAVLPVAPSTTSFSGNENARPRSLAATGLASPPPATQQFRTSLAGGINYTGDNQGNRTYTMGTPGQDGYGRVSVRPGSASGQAARNRLAADVPQVGQQTRQVGGFTITGDAGAVERFSRPVGMTGPGTGAGARARAGLVGQRDPNQSYGDWLDSLPAQYDKRVGDAPPQGSDLPLIAPPPRANGGTGWKSQIEADKANAAAYGDYVRALSSAQSSAAQERGANYRAGLQQQGVNDRNAIDAEKNDMDRRKLGGELGFNEARIKTEGINQQKGQMEVDSLRKAQELRDIWIKNPTPENEAAYRGAIGKFEKEAQFGTVGKYDDQGMKIGEDVYNKQTGERKEDGQSGGTFESPMPIPKSEKELKKGHFYINQQGGVGYFDGTGLRRVG